MMDDIPGWAFVAVGVVIAVYSTFVSLKTDALRFIFFFIAAAVLIAFGMVRMMFFEGRKAQHYEPPPRGYNPYLDPPQNGQQFPLPPGMAPRQGSSQQGMGTQAGGYPQQGYAPARPQAPSPRAHRGFYQAPQQKSRFHDAVRRQRR